MNSLLNLLPHGGTLIQRVSVRSTELPSESECVELSKSDLINVYNIAWGYYSPLKGFLKSKDYRSVVDNMRLDSGDHWTIPILLRIDTNKAEDLRKVKTIGLKFNNKLIGQISNIEIFKVDTESDKKKIFGTDELKHPGVSLYSNQGEYSIGGDVTLYDDSQPEIKGYINTQDFRSTKSVPGLSSFSTRNIPHIGHEYIQRTLLETSSGLGILIISGAEVPGKFKSEFVYNYYKSYSEQNYPKNRCFVNRILLPPIYGGPREAFLQATVLQNLGYTHFVVGRDHAGCGSYYSKYASQEIFESLTSLRINIVPFKEPRHCPFCELVTTEKSCPHAESDKIPLNGTDIRKALQEGDEAALKKILKPESIKLLKGFHESENIFEE